MSTQIKKHLSTLSAKSILDIQQGNWDEVMTDALYAAVGADTVEQMQEAKFLAEEMAWFKPLIKGEKYDVSELTFEGFSEGDGSGSEGYNWEAYFTPAAEYLGPDEHGIEPVFAA